MQRATWTLLTVVSSLMLAGCGDSPTPDGSVHSTAASPAGSPATAAQDGHGASPAETVAQFYQALRTGQEADIAALLTDKARTETTNNGLDIQSQGSSRLEYELGEVDYVDDGMQGAHVKSLWIDFTPDGERIGTEVIWVLRKQPEGWRIAGMATQVLEDQLPLFFNFEDPEDMLRKKEYVEQQYRVAEEAAETRMANPDEVNPPESLYR